MCCNYLDAASYKWIFVSGNGSVGKTTIACYIAQRLSRKKQTLLISLDIVNSVSAFFGKDFIEKPRKVPNFSNLYATECKTNLNKSGTLEAYALSVLFTEITIDDFDVVVFDCSSISSTINLMTLPIFSIPMLSDAASNAYVRSVLGDSISFQKTSKTISEIVNRLRNPKETAVICVLIPEYRPLLLAEALIQELMDKEIETKYLVVNRIFPEVECKKCAEKRKVHLDYLKHIHELYKDLNIAEVNELGYGVDHTNLSDLDPYFNSFFSS